MSTSLSVRARAAFVLFPWPAFFNSFCFATSVSLVFLNFCPSVMVSGISLLSYIAMEVEITDLSVSSYSPLMRTDLHRVLSLSSFTWNLFIYFFRSQKVFEQVDVPVCFTQSVFIRLPLDKIRLNPEKQNGKPKPYFRNTNFQKLPAGAYLNWQRFLEASWVLCFDWLSDSEWFWVSLFTHHGLLIALFLKHKMSKPEISILSPLSRVTFRRKFVRTPKLNKCGLW